LIRLRQLADCTAANHIQTKTFSLVTRRAVAPIGKWSLTSMQQRLVKTATFNKACTLLLAVLAESHPRLGRNEKN
jgi:hypothetical protein